MLKVIKPCAVKLGGVIQYFSPGATLHLGPSQEKKLVEAGYAETVQPHIDDHRRLCEELAERDPRGGCWDWVVKNVPEVWQRFMQALFTDDFATARQQFDEAIAAWGAARNG